MPICSRDISYILIFDLESDLLETFSCGRDTRDV